MRVIISSLILLLSFTACNNEKKHDGARFKGTVKNVEDSTAVYLGKLGKNSSRVALDTTYVMDESFSFDIPEEDFATLNVINFEGIQGNMLFINNQADIEAEVYKDSLRKSTIKGGRDNKLFQDYVNHLYTNQNEMKALRKEYSSYNLRENKEKLTEARQKQKKIKDRDIEFRKKSIKENPNSLSSALILADMVRTNMIPNKEVKELYGNLSEEVQRSTSGQEIQQTINKLNATEIGAKAPAFSAPTPDGDELSLEQALSNKYTILDFWASWCKPCRMENPHMVELYKKYHDKGLNILSVSLDKPNQKDRWLKAIEKDNMTWQHVSNLQFWQGPIVDQYSVKSIPATFILDSEGKIVAKGLRQKKLDKKLEELFKG